MVRCLERLTRRRALHTRVVSRAAPPLGAMRIHGHRFRGAVGRRITRCGHHHDGRWRSFALNKGAELIFGYTAAEALGRSIIELIVPGLPSSGGLGARRQRACYQLCRIPVRTAACQPEQPARSGRQKIYTAEKVAHRCAKGRLVPLIQCAQEAVEQDRGSASSGRGGNEVHVVVLAASKSANATAVRQPRPDVPRVLDQLQAGTAQAVRCLGTRQGLQSQPGEGGRAETALSERATPYHGCSASYGTTRLYYCPTRRHSASS
jgi:hypothetical protein